MRKIKEVLPLKFEAKLSHEKVEPAHYPHCGTRFDERMPGS